MLITVPCTISLVPPNNEKGHVCSNVSKSKNGSRRRKGERGWGAPVLVHGLSVNPSPFSSVACIALEPFIRIK